METLAGTNAVVTGAAAGLGRGFAEVLARSGADVAICDIQPKVQQVADTIAAESGRQVPWWLADVSNPDEVKDFIDDAAALLGGIDLLVNNAGVWQPSDPTADRWEDAVDAFEWMHGTNLKGSFLAGRAAMPHLIAAAAKTGTANIVNIATDHITPPPGAATGGGRWMDIYDSSKWGLNGLTQSWSKVLAQHRVRVNALCMDATVSEMLIGAAGDRWSEAYEARVMQPHQIAELMLELIAEGPDGRTGENIGVWLGHPIELPDRQPVLPSRHD